MGLITKDYTFTTGSTIVASEHNTNFDVLYNEINGGLSNSNIAANAGIVDTKLAQITTPGKVSTDALTDTGGYIFQTGMIIIWSGAISAIPTGWTLCDGTASTPDLTDRFVIHADADSGGTNDVGDTGGASTHALIEAELPAHTHPVPVVNTSTNLGTDIAGATSIGANGNGTTGSTGSGTAHTNRDKYYALAYIMKT